MLEYCIDDLKRVLVCCANKTLENKTRLEEIDSLAGDGDLGISMQKAADALLIEVADYEQADIGKFFFQCAKAVNKAAPSTMGTLLSAGLMRLGKDFAMRETIGESEIIEIPASFAQSIEKRGGASEGQRTILDALWPLARAMQIDYADCASLPHAILEGIAAAEDGMNRTKEMLPQKGRAKWMPENAAGVVDGGAMLCWIIAKSMADVNESASLSL